jgi:hypothetical protein
MAMNWLKITGACVAIGAVAAFGLVTAASAQEKIRIGVVLPLGGQFAYASTKPMLPFRQ